MAVTRDIPILMDYGVQDLMMFHYFLTKVRVHPEVIPDNQDNEIGTMICLTNMINAIEDEIDIKVEYMKYEGKL